MKLFSRSFAENTSRRKSQPVDDTPKTKVTFILWFVSFIHQEDNAK